MTWFLAMLAAFGLYVGQANRLPEREWWAPPSAKPTPTPWVPPCRLPCPKPTPTPWVPPGQL